MSYSSLLSNQTISFTNLQSGVSEGYFTAKTTIPINLKQITKTEANTYVNINTSLPSYAAKAPNELVTKNDLSGITSASPYTMYGVAGTAGYKSLDGGNTFTALSGLPSLSWTGIAGDITGLNIAAISFTQNNQVYISNDGGVSFTAITLSGALIGFYATGVAMSDNGQYIAVAGINSTGPEGTAYAVSLISISSNYGAFFSAIFVDSVLEDYIKQSGKVSVSGNGQYITAVFAHETDPGYPNVARPFSYRLYSSNYGASFTKSGSSEYNAYFDIALSYTGQHQFLTSDWLRPGLFGEKGIKAYVSNNYGTSFTQKVSSTTAYVLGGASNSGFISATISDDGKTMVGTTDGNDYVPFLSGGLAPVLVASTNFGSTFPISQTFTYTVGIAGGNIVTAGITNNYIAMMLSNIGQFNYSVDGGTSFTPKATTGYPWEQIYRKAFIYVTTTTTTTVAPTHNYYDVTRFNCPNCTSPSYGDVARNNTTGGILTTGYYYNNGDGYVYRIDGYNAGPSYTIDLDGSASDIDCSTACSI
jgi:hypothetical protein